jgi:hypothetical protein
MSEVRAKARAAEGLLFDLAAELRFVPIQGEATRTHLRALELKRELRSWEEKPPDDGARIDAVLEELRRLSVEARRYRQELRTVKQLARPTSVRPLAVAKGLRRAFVETASIRHGAS